MSFLREAIERYADRPLAVDDAGDTITYARVGERADAWRRRLGPDKRLVLVLSENRAAILGDYLALLLAGHAVVPLGAEISQDALAGLRARFSPELIVRAGESEVETVHESRPAGGLHPDLAVLLSTSGSTGSPKLVRFDLARMAANAASIVDYLDLSADERPLAHLPFHYSYGLSVVHSHAAVGATLLLSTQTVVSPLFWRRADAATSLSGVPFHYEMLLRLRFERRAMPRLRTLTQAGGRLAPEHVRRIAEIAGERGWRFYVMYGQTEAGPRISYLPPSEAIDRPDSIGIPIPGVRLSVTDEEGGEVGADPRGELVVESGAVMMGYAEQRGDLARGDDFRGRLVTGDLARRDADGFWYLTGRRSRFVKLRGNRVGLDDVERRLAARGFEAVCVGEDDRLFVVVGADADEAALGRVTLEEFSFPPGDIRIVRLDGIPRTAAQKVNYRALLETVKSGPPS